MHLVLARLLLHAEQVVHGGYIVLMNVTVQSSLSSTNSNFQNTKFRKTTMHNLRNVQVLILSLGTFPMEKLCDVTEMVA